MCREILLFSMCFLGVFRSIAHGQTDCQYTFEASAGPDIHVCEGGQVLLTAEVSGGVNDIYWRGGQGQFLPDRKSANVEYIPDSTEVGSVVVLTLVAKRNDSECPPVRDDVAISVDKILSVDAGDNIYLCPGGRVDLDGRVLAGEWGSVTWKTSGTGYFEQSNSLNAVYFPSDKDIKDGGCALRMVVTSAGVCLPDSDALAVQIFKIPIFSLPETITSSAEEVVKLNAKLSGSVDEILWYSDGDGEFDTPESDKTSYTPGDQDVKKGSVKITCTIASQGCTKAASTELIIRK